MASSSAIEYDVVFFDEVSSSYQENTPNERGIGGSELGVITLSKELARLGYSVLVLNDPIEIKLPFPPVQEPIIAPSGVHYASCRGEIPPIACQALIVQHFSSVPSVTSIERERTLMWLHDSSGSRTDFAAQKLSEATSKRLNRGGAVPVFVSEWQRDSYPQDFVGRFGVVIPNMLPRILFDPKWLAIPQEDTLVFASAAARGLDATLAVWADPRVAAAGTTVLEVMGPAYDPPPFDIEEASRNTLALKNRVRFLGSQTLHALLERLAASRGLLFANTWPETFCLLVAYSEALGKPARFIGLSPYGIGGVGATMANQRFLYNPKELEKFTDDLASEIQSGERLAMKHVMTFHPDTVMPQWINALGI